MAAHELVKPDGDPAEVLKAMFLASDLIHKQFPEIPVFPVFGNNDLPGDYILPNETSKWYSTILKKWFPLILCNDCPDEVARPTDMETLSTTFLKGGYYNVSIEGEGDEYPHFRISTGEPLFFILFSFTLLILLL